MDDKEQLVFNVEDRSYFALLKKAIHAMAVSAEFSEEKTGKLDIIVAEMVTNLVKHAGGGQLIARKFIDIQWGPGIELLAIDNGPGIPDLKKMLKDGMSTKNTLGQGLGAIQRLSNKCEIYSLKDWGTIILSRVFKSTEPVPHKRENTLIRGLAVPKPGEELCGDGFYYKITKDKIKMFLGDGLGHGKDAAFAVNEAIRVFKQSYEERPADILRDIHRNVRKTRGLVACVAIFHFHERMWRICGIGNILAKISSHVSNKNYVAHNGIIGYNIPTTLKDQEIAYEPGQHIIMCSDGIKTRWELAKFPAILNYDLSVLTAAIYKDQSRHTDDSSVLAAKINL